MGDSNGDLHGQVSVLEQKCQEQAKALTMLHSLFCEIENGASIRAGIFHKMQVQVSEKEKELDNLHKNHARILDDLQRLQAEHEEVASAEQVEQLQKQINDLTAQYQASLQSNQTLVQKLQDISRASESRVEQLEHDHKEQLKAERETAAQNAAGLEEKHQQEIQQLHKQALQRIRAQATELFARLVNASDSDAPTAFSQLEDSVAAKTNELNARLSAATSQLASLKSTSSQAGAEEKAQFEQMQRQSKKQIRVLEAQLRSLTAEVESARAKADAADKARKAHEANFQAAVNDKTSALKAQLEREKQRNNSLASKQKNFDRKLQQARTKSATELQHTKVQLSQARVSVAALRQQLQRSATEKETLATKLRRALSQAKKLEMDRQKGAKKDGGDSDTDGSPPSTIFASFIGQLLFFLAGGLAAFVLARMLQ